VGSTFRLSLILEDEDGNAIDLTGYTAALKGIADDGETVLVDADTDAGITVTADTGSIVVASPVLAGPATGTYDLAVKNPANEVDYLVEGILTIEPRVTEL
jgi:hypothetical protein